MPQKINYRVALISSFSMIFWRLSLSKLAPISIATYSRLEHLVQTISSLKENPLAKESILYIFSDAPRKGHEEAVNKLRDYIKTVDGFLEVRLIFQEENNMKKNIRESYEIPLSEFGRVIWMEDDNVVSGCFLEYMNNALDYYNDDERVISIAGHSKFLNVPYIKDDVFKLNSFHAWGVGYWSRSIKSLKEITLDIFSEDISNRQLVKRLARLPDTMLYSYIPSQIYGRFDAGDVKYHYTMTKEDLYSIYPSETLVRNIGCDGSGFHCGVDDSYSLQKITDKNKFKFLAIEDVQDLTIESNINNKYSFITKIKMMAKYPMYSFYLVKLKILGRLYK